MAVGDKVGSSPTAHSVRFAHRRTEKSPLTRRRPPSDQAAVSVRPFRVLVVIVSERSVDRSVENYE